jgi:hypothetical protein
VRPRQIPPPSPIQNILENLPQQENIDSNMEDPNIAELTTAAPADPAEPIPSLEDLFNRSSTDPDLRHIKTYLNYVLNQIHKRYVSHHTEYQFCDTCHQPFVNLTRHHNMDPTTKYGCHRVAQLRYLLLERYNYRFNFENPQFQGGNLSDYE